MDKVQKIREEVERRMNCFKNERNTLLKASDNNLSLGARIAMCEEILSFIDSLQEEPVSEDLEEAAEGYAVTDEVLPNGKVMINFQVEKAFRAGANWQKEQMMAKGIDGIVHLFGKCEVASVHYNEPTGVPMSYFTSSEGLSAGNKVKIIVIKED